MGMPQAAGLWTIRYQLDKLGLEPKSLKVWLLAFAMSARFMKMPSIACVTGEFGARADFFASVEVHSPRAKAGGFRG
jgi:hypothetical protein